MMIPRRKDRMARTTKLIIALFVLACCLIFAAALAGGLMDESAFTTAAHETPAGHDQAAQR
jgi:NADH:ubiquinone oxidoreductase subunit B-like Fe-S oxidoreductase